MKWFLCLIEILRIFLQILFLTKQSVFDENDPPWFNSNIKQLIQEKNNKYKNYILSDKSFQKGEKSPKPASMFN